MQPLRKGRYLARLADKPGDLLAAQRLRWLCFVAGSGATDTGGVEADAHDARCSHLLVVDTATGQLVCCFRFLRLPDGRDIDRSYSAQFYDLSTLAAFGNPMIEVGRFCVHPAAHDPDIIRIAWVVLTRLVGETDARMLFGCSSFAGTEPDVHAEAFALLRARHLGPTRWRPGIRAPNVVPLSRMSTPDRPDPRRAMAAMPPLLRSYLALGGWVSDHAVVDPVLRTMHVFTGVEIGAIPPARRRSLLCAAM